MARTKVLYRFTIGKPLDLTRDFFTPLKNENFPTIALADFYDNEDPSNSYIFTEHQFRFEVNMDETSNPNTGFAEITNVDEEVKNYLTKTKDIVCIIEAGDNEQGLKKIFEGTTLGVKYEEDDTDNRLRITLGDGSISAKNAKTTRTYPRGTPYETIIKDLTKDMKLPMAKFYWSGLSNDNTTRVLDYPISFVGKTHGILTTELPKLGLNYNIQNNEINIIPKTKRVSEEVSIITKDTGLVGKVGIDENKNVGTSANKQDDTQYIQFTCLIDGSILPNESVYVKDGDFDGPYKVTSVKFEFDYEGGSHYCHVKAKTTDGVINV